MNELMDSKWCLDPSGTKIITDTVDRYENPLLVLAVSDAQPQMLAHICHIHNEWLEDQWSEEAFHQALERDD